MSSKIACVYILQSGPATSELVGFLQLNQQGLLDIPGWEFDELEVLEELDSFWNRIMVIAHKYALGVDVFGIVQRSGDFVVEILHHLVFREIPGDDRAAFKSVGR